MAAAKISKREQIRYDREAKALQKNLEKRKLQQKKRDELKKVTSDEQDSTEKQD